jgi:molybdopterin synthase sulfur carrier subunit
MTVDLAITVQYFAGARAAAGLASEAFAAGTLAEVLASAVDRHGPELERVLSASSYLIDGTNVRDRATAIPPGATVDILPPFAGG